MGWAQLSHRQPCAQEAGVSALPGEAAAAGSGGIAGMAAGVRVLLPAGDAVLPVALTSLPEALPLIPAWPARLGGKARSALQPRG